MIQAKRKIRPSLLHMSARGEESFTYDDWFVEQNFLLYSGPLLLMKWMESFKEFPPRAKAASFTIDQAVQSLTPKTYAFDAKQNRRIPKRNPVAKGSGLYACNIRRPRTTALGDFDVRQQLADYGPTSTTNIDPTRTRGFLRSGRFRP